MDKDTTAIVDGNGSQKSIEGRIKQLRTQIDETTSDYDREKLQKRRWLASVAIIKVGAATETEMKEKDARVEDALHASRADVVPRRAPTRASARSRFPKRLSATPQAGSRHTPLGQRRWAGVTGQVDATDLTRAISQGRRFRGSGLDRQFSGPPTYASKWMASMFLEAPAGGVCLFQDQMAQSAKLIRQHKPAIHIPPRYPAFATP